MGADPFGSVPKLERIGLACARDLLYPIQFGSAIRTSLGRIESPCQFGSDPFESRGDARIQSRTRADGRRGLFSSALHWIGSISVASTPDLYGPDPN